MTAQNEGEPGMMSQQELEAIRERWGALQNRRNQIWDIDGLVASWEDIPALLSYIEALSGLLAALVEVGPPADDNHSQYACCGVHYTQEHPAWCPWLLAKEATQ